MNSICKLCLGIALIGATLVRQSAWAKNCEEPSVSGYDYVHCLKEGLAGVAKGKKYGFVNGLGQLVIPLQYDDIHGFNGGYASVKKDEKWGVIDKTGKTIIPLQYGAIYYVGADLFVATNGSWSSETYALINTQNQPLTPFKYYAHTIRGNDGVSVYPDKFTNNKQLIKVAVNDEVRYLNKLGKEYLYLSDTKNELKLVKDSNNLYGFINTSGQEVIPLIYQDADNFSNGLAYVKKDGKYGYIDTSGKTVIGFQYKDADSFNNGKARVHNGDDGKTPKYFYIDKTGKILTTRTSLADFRKKLEQGDDVYYETKDSSGRGMIFEIKGNLVQVQTKESQCSQRDYKGNCQNYIDNQVGKWLKKSEVYPNNHLD